MCRLFERGRGARIYPRSFTPGLDRQPDDGLNIAVANFVERRHAEGLRWRDYAPQS